MVICHAFATGDQPTLSTYLQKMKNHTGATAERALSLFETVNNGPMSFSKSPRSIWNDAVSFAIENEFWSIVFDLIDHARKVGFQLGISERSLARLVASEQFQIIEDLINGHALLQIQMDTLVRDLANKYS